MLDNETKRRIDTARDVLVGKVPDPKSQVEQITIALIYKFMDDMDKESIEMGGKSSFFNGEYEKYAWSKIFDPHLGGFEMLALYADAITKLNQNPSIPQLFRDIFKNAYLPYRDPETLKLFLKTINDFTYDHSEQLGDAFEYLLSVLGSQGDAGQFRTPRHIIDFMVKVVNPQKNETILDPACGTAGFLVSSFKHIMRENTSPQLRSENGNGRGDLLTTDDRKKLLTNFRGYDISPDMVRLSLVNLYLHGFVQPQLLEYDTLTSEDRWNEYADVIMANPPFMSPKGGIKPHKKFSVQSNRSEVLFVDYIAEHLTPTGRAAVIVPEGIIFQSANAYKKLRKLLVENYLYAVVSLPAGIFNPYSGVKTSILLMDKQLAKKTDSILFVKIANDGYGLGAQRREIVGSDLPYALNVINDYLKVVQTGKVDSFKPEDLPRAESRGKPCWTLLVKKAQLAENEDYNLTGERYRVAVKRGNQKWPMVKLEDVCDINPETAEPVDLFGKSAFWYIDISSVENGTGKLLLTNEITPEEAPSRARRIVKNGDVLLSTVRPNLKSFTYLSNLPEKVLASTGFAVLRAKENLIPKFLYLSVLSDHVVNQMISQMGKGAYPSINSSDVEVIRIPLPPLEVQREIVAEIEGYQKIIDGARQVVDSWKPQIEIDPQWPMMKLGDIAQIVRGSSPRPAGDPKYYGGSIPRLMVADLTRDGMYVTPQIDFLTEEGAKLSRPMKKGELIMAVSGQPGLCAILNIDCCIHDGFAGFHDFNLNTVNIEYMYYQLSHLKESHNSLSVGAVFQNLKTDQLRKFSVYIPTLEIQRTIVAKIDAERKVIDGCRELIKNYETKIKNVIDKVWEE